MPYVDEKTRKRLDDPYRRVNHANFVGQLTYVVQKELEVYIKQNGLSYQTLAECLGALEGAKADLIHRVLLPYEHTKRQENGDVWPLEMLSADRD